MGVPGPPPKPGAARRNKDTFTPTHHLPAAGPQAEPPEPMVELGERGRDWWDLVWRSPVAAQWHPIVDLAALSRLASMVDLLAADPAIRAPLPSNFLSEIRQLEDRFGLSPEARKKLRWEIVDDERAGAGAMTPKPRLKVTQDGSGNVRAIPKPE